MSLLGIGLELLLVLLWTSAVMGNGSSAEYVCKDPNIEVQFSLCASYDGLDHGNQIGCDFVCMLLGKPAAATIRPELAIQSFFNWCMAARQPIAIIDLTPDEAEMSYAEFVVLMAAVTPACIRESLVVFDDVVSQNSYKSTEPDMMSWRDMDTWLRAVSSFVRPNQRKNDAREYSITKQDFQKYWNEKVLARIELEQIKCNRDDLPPGSAEERDPTTSENEQYADDDHNPTVPT